MTNTFNRLLSGGILRTVNLFVTITISFFMMPFLVEQLGDKTYGLWVLIGSLMGYYMVVDFGLLSATQRYLARHLEDTARLNSVINTAFYLLSKLSLFAVVLTGFFWFFAKYLVADASVVPTMQALILILGSKTILTLPLMVFNGMLSAKLRFDIASYIEISKNVLRTVLIVLYLLNGYNVVALAAITLISELLAFVAITICAVRLYPEAKYGVSYVDKTLSKELFKFGKYSFLGETSNLLKSRVDDIVIAKLIGLASVTHYAIAYSLFNYAGQFINNLLGGLVTVFTTSINDGSEILKKRFMVFTEICAFVATFFTVFMVLVGQVFIKLWMGEDYADSYNILVIFSLILLLTASTRACLPLFYALAKHKKIAYWNLYEGLSNLMLSVVLVSKIGLIGVAIGTLIPALFFRVALQVNYARYLIQLTLRDFWGPILKHWLAGGLFYIACLSIELESYIGNFFDLFALCGVAAIIYVILVSRYILTEKVKVILINNLSHKIPSKILNFIFGIRKRSGSI